MRILLGTVAQRPALALTRTLALALAASLVAAPALAGPGPHHGSHPGPGPEAPEWQVSVIDADQSFRGLDAVDRRTAWAAGSSVTGGAGKVYRTTDGGRSWRDVSPPGTEGLSLRDVEARDARTAVVLAIGPGEDSRIFRTTDGGASWTETFRNTDESAFYNCLGFYPGGKRGLAVSDPVDGRFQILSTEDGGRSWTRLPDDGMPASPLTETGDPAEFNFSASGDCLVVEGNDAWFGTGGEVSRIFHTRDRGRTWQATESTLPAGEAAGVFALALRTPREGVAVGGDFGAEAGVPAASARTRDGRRWTPSGALAHLGEDAAWLSGARSTLIAVGESGPVGGSSLSRDGGRTWEQFSETAFHTLDCTDDGSCWAAGGRGRVGRL
ncbi:WD40/YVTN/BNR-like repeat-containing protein [Nocardioides campestrisoli]|uniref:WD40/YVTN/BNR-like repeat-containing protein n=1 Tax=Nocardioides campestrisoli TaxID=2736757 RepID=UPI001C62A12F|nr:oxidoreductase [Nocardioides campestrisoli]